MKLWRILIGHDWKTTLVGYASAVFALYESGGIDTTNKATTVLTIAVALLGRMAQDARRI